MGEHVVTYVRRVWVPHSFEKAQSIVSKISGQNALVFGKMPLGALLQPTGPLHAHARTAIGQDVDERYGVVPCEGGGCYFEARARIKGPSKGTAELGAGVHCTYTNPVIAYERVACLPQGTLGEWPEIAGPVYGVSAAYHEATARAEKYGFIVDKGFVPTAEAETAMRSHKPCPPGQEPAHPRLSRAYQGLLEIGTSYKGGVDEPARMIPGPTAFLHPVRTAANFVSMPFRAPAMAKVIGTLWR